MKLYPQARTALSSSLRFAVVVAWMSTLIVVGVHAQPKPTAQTITVYQDPG